MSFHAKTLTLILSIGIVATASAQRPEIVRHEMTGVIEVMIGDDGADRLRADLTQSILNAGHHTVTQETICGTLPEGVLDSSSYDWDMDEQVKNAEGQAQQLSPIKDPIHDDQGRLISFEYLILLRTNDSTAVGHTQINYGPDGLWMEIHGDSADPSNYTFRADYNDQGRVVRMSSSTRDFDYEVKQWKETSSSWTNDIGYDEEGRVVDVDHTSIIGDKDAYRSVQTNTYNDEGFVTLIKRFQDTPQFNCGGEKVDAPAERLANGLYQYREDRYIYR